MERLFEWEDGKHVSDKEYQRPKKDRRRERERERNRGRERVERKRDKNIERGR